MKMHLRTAFVACGRLAGLLPAVLLANPGMAADSCRAALARVDPVPFLAVDGQCVADRPALCHRLQELTATEFDTLASSLRGEAPAPGHGDMSLQSALTACGLDYADLQARQCSRAYSHEDLDFVLKYCREEAWSLARAQCERASDTVSERYADFCYRFHHGMAP
jgi:hypothetical protein